jgi:iron complex outermembrane receptor protein
MTIPKSVGVLAAVLFLPATPALAQAADELPQIVVTGIRQAYRGDFALRETPQAVAVIDARTIDENIILRLTDALDLDASIARQNNFGGLWDSFAVRGFAGDENLPSGYLVNGFNGGRGFGGTRDVAGIERIEILKGPNAALFGRGEPGGTVNIVTKRAEFGTTKGSASATYGSFDSIRGDADLNLAIGENVGVRLISFYEDAASFRDTINSNRYGFLPSVAVRLGADTTLAYDLELTRQEIPFDRGIVTINGRLDAIPRSRFLGEPGDGPIKAGATGHQLQLQHAFDSNWSLLLGANYRETSLEGFSTEAELARARQKLFVDGRSLSRQRRFRDYDAEHLVVRGELAGDFALGTLRNRILIGADYDRFDNSQLFLRFRPPTVTGTLSDLAGNVIDVLNPVYGRFALPTPGPQTNRLDTQQASGVYFQDQITLSDRLQVRIGARYDSFKLRSLNRATAVAQERSADRFSPQAGIVFEASEAVSLYAAYGQGFRSNIGADAAGRVFDPETSKSFEVGAKLALFDNALNGTVSIFELSKSNVLAADPANPGFSIPIGRARSRGLELDLNGKLPGEIDVRFSYAYIDAQARSEVLDPNFSLAIRVGDRLINLPRHSLNAQISKAFSVGASTLRVGTGVQYVGERLGETATSFILPDYTLGRLFVSWTITERIELTGEVNNLFNTTYYTNSFSSLWVQPGSPRTGSVSVRVRF